MMRELFTFLIALWAIALVSVPIPASAFGCSGWLQIAGGNGCNSSIAGGGGGGYTGPGDIAPGAKAWWGLRAYSAAKRGTRAVNVCNVSDVACVDFNTDATTGTLVITVGGATARSSPARSKFGTIKAAARAVHLGRLPAICPKRRQLIAPRSKLIASGRCRAAKVQAEVRH
jgi:hypothetical protein